MTSRTFSRGIEMLQRPIQNRHPQARIREFGPDIAQAISISYARSEQVAKGYGRS
jgi:hypothetical protein